MRSRLVAAVACVALASCASQSRGTRAGIAGASSVGSALLGVGLLAGRSDCSGNSEEPNACTFGDHAGDFALTFGGYTALATSAVLLGAMVYLLAK